MVKIKFEVKADREIISILGLKQGLDISYSGDVDLTSLVSELTALLENGSELELDSLDITNDDEKISLILKTIKDILLEYNNCLQPEESIEDDVPF